MARRLVLLAVAPARPRPRALDRPHWWRRLPAEGATANPGTLSPEAERAIPRRRRRDLRRDGQRAGTSTSRSWRRSARRRPITAATRPPTRSTRRAARASCSSASAARAATTGAATSATATTTGACSITDFWDNVCAALAACGATRARRPPAARRPATTRPPATTTAPARTASANYADEVMARAKLYGFVGGTRHRPCRPAGRRGHPAARGCGGVAIAAGDGEFIVDPGANRPGADLAPELVGFVRRMAEFLPRPPIVTTGTNHSPTTTSGNPSDHWTGNAADFGSVRNGFPATGGGYGDAIAEAAFLAAGEPTATARAERPRWRRLHDRTRGPADPDHLEDAARRQPLRPRPRRRATDRLIAGDRPVSGRLRSVPRAN